jgi:uroporphyrinogen III methyltransferase / synthase
VFPETLRAAGVSVDVVEAYRTRAAEERAPHGFDAVTFTSSSTVERFVELYADVALERVVVASIGPITSETCRRLGIHVNVEAHPYTIPALIEALERAFTSR